MLRKQSALCRVGDSVGQGKAPAWVGREGNRPQAPAGPSWLCLSLPLTCLPWCLPCSVLIFFVSINISQALLLLSPFLSLHLNPLVVPIKPHDHRSCCPARPFGSSVGWGSNGAKIPRQQLVSCFSGLGFPGWWVRTQMRSRQGVGSSSRRPRLSCLPVHQKWELSCPPSFPWGQQ